VATLTQYRGGGGRPLVLLHGLGLSWRSWRPVLPALEARHDVTALDLPGFGASAPLDRGVRPTPRALADAVAGELDRLGLDAPIVVGNSLGGWIALELARAGAPSASWPSRRPGSRRRTSGPTSSGSTS
jgi:pimeloyl-ACP methyl ester carboxylesterase